MNGKLAAAANKLLANLTRFANHRNRALPSTTTTTTTTTTTSTTTTTTAARRKTTTTTTTKTLFVQSLCLAGAAGEG